MDQPKQQSPKKYAMQQWPQEFKQVKHPPLKELMPLLNPIYPEQYAKLSVDVYQRIRDEDFSAKTNQLIEKLLTFGQTNYTCYLAKKQIYYAGNTTIQHEDQFSQQLLLDQNQKNFQLWDFRNFIYDTTKNHTREYQLMQKILQYSPKNYHLWSNRTRLVGIVGNYLEEITATQKYILKDYYNNSAWAYRGFCFRRIQEGDRNYNYEINFVLDKIKKFIDNEAAWNYLRGYFPSYKLCTTNLTPKPVTVQSLLSYAEYPQIKQACKQIIQNKQTPQKLKIQTLITIMIIDSQSQDTVHYAKEVCRYLAELQPIRRTYYLWVESSL